MNYSAVNIHTMTANNESRHDIPKNKTRNHKTRA